MQQQHQPEGRAYYIWRFIMFVISATMGAISIH